MVVPHVDLPGPVEVYFSSKGREERRPLAEYFTAGAVVWDNGEDLKLGGLDAIQAWMWNTSDKYKLTTELRSTGQREYGFVVSVIVSGDFLGSPYEFAYRFTLSGDKISELVIDPIGSLAGS
jgi:hypothetical protein